MSLKTKKDQSGGLHRTTALTSLLQGDPAFVSGTLCSPQRSKFTLGVRQLSSRVQQTEAIAPAERDSDSRFLSPPWVWAKLLTGSENQLSKQCPTNIGGFTRSAAH